MLMFGFDAEREPILWAAQPKHLACCLALAAGRIKVKHALPTCLRQLPIGQSNGENSALRCVEQAVQGSFFIGNDRAGCGHRSSKPRRAEPCSVELAKEPQSRNATEAILGARGKFRGKEPATHPRADLRQLDPGQLCLFDQRETSADAR
jgi:hypothetical protein